MEENLDKINYREIGLRIKAARVKKNVYQIVLAEKLGISQTHMSNIESGRAGLTLENLAAICEALDCTFDYIILGKEDKDTEIDMDDLANVSVEDLLNAMKMVKLLKKQ